MQDDDDRQIGRMLTRREALAVLAAGAVFLPACGGSDSGDSSSGTTATTGSTGQTGGTTATSAIGGAAAQVPAPSCIVKPESTEGPFFVDERLNRSDIRSDPSGGSVRGGIPLKLAFRVARLGSNGCTAYPNATVDVWHCDAGGVYSGVSAGNAAGQKFLRGYQTTDGNGFASFTTIYPGWYQGRAVHIHFKIRTPEGKDFTSQLFFDEGVNDQVFSQAPYNTRSGSRTRNSSDGIFRQGGNDLLLRLTPDGEGYASTFEIGLQA
jgi:protocatechuate 3,4-dioxygenase beta subunit